MDNIVGYGIGMTRTSVKGREERWHLYRKDNLRN